MFHRRFSRLLWHFSNPVSRLFESHLLTSRIFFQLLSLLKSYSIAKLLALFFRSMFFSHCKILNLVPFGFCSNAKFSNLTPFLVFFSQINTFEMLFCSDDGQIQSMGFIPSVRFFFHIAKFLDLTLLSNLKLLNVLPFVVFK